MDYADAGVHLELGDDASKLLYEAAKVTWSNRKGKFGEIIVPTDDFSGVRAIDVSNLPLGSLMNIGFDGVGTKMELAERTSHHETIAYDLFAMVCDDAVVRNAEPVIIGSILDVNSLGCDDVSYIDFVKQLAVGYIGAARDAGVAVVNGEIAELGARVSGYGPFNYNWGAGVVWFARKDQLFTGREIKVGDYLIGLKEDGFRSNGLSLVRKVYKEKFGDDWHLEEYGESSLGDLVLYPSRIYTGTIVDMTGGFQGESKVEVHGVAHITGGGIPGKLGRVLKPSGLGAEIINPFAAPAIMTYCQELGNVTDEKAYVTWNMGLGMILISPDYQGVIDIAKDHCIEARVIGQVTDSHGINIFNMGCHQSREYLHFEPQ